MTGWDVILGTAALLVPAVVVTVIVRRVLGGDPFGDHTPRTAPKTQAHQQAVRDQLGGFGPQG